MGYWSSDENSRNALRTTLCENQEGTVLWLDKEQPPDEVETLSREDSLLTFYFPSYIGI